MVTARQSMQARRRLDLRFAELRSVRQLAAPSAGWIRAIRDALGMSARVLGQRLGVTSQAVHAMEASEVAGKIQIETLRRAADAMDCVLVYAMLPKSSLQEFVDEQATRIARAQAHAAAMTMALEDQAIEVDDDLIAQRAQALTSTGHIWRNDVA